MITPAGKTARTRVVGASWCCLVLVTGAGRPKMKPWA
jgi:hypothetical protein